MPQNVENLTLDLDEIPENECKHIPVKCTWIITSKVESLTVIITCSKRTFNYDFCVRVKAQPQGAPYVLKQIDLDGHHLLPNSLTDALNLYDAFPESHINTHVLDILEELIEFLDLNFRWSLMAATQFANHDLATDNSSGTDPDPDEDKNLLFN